MLVSLLLRHIILNLVISFIFHNQVIFIANQNNRKISISGSSKFIHPFLPSHCILQSLLISEISNYKCSSGLSSKQLIDASNAILSSNVPDVQSDGRISNIVQFECVFSRNRGFGFEIKFVMHVPADQAGLSAAGVANYTNPSLNLDSKSTVQVQWNGWKQKKISNCIFSIFIIFINW